MSRKSLIASVVVVLALVGVISLGVSCSSPSSGSGEIPVQRSTDIQYRLLPSVPSDAAMLMTFSGIDDALSILSDTTKAFSSILTDNGKRGFQDFVMSLGQNIPDSFKGEEVIISMHNSGDLVPLMLIGAPVDSTDDVAAVYSLAKEKGVDARYFTASRLSELMGDATGLSLRPSQVRLAKTGLLLVSSSQTLLTASQRHLEGGMSILDKKGFPQIAALMEGEDALMISCEYSGKILSTFMGRGYGNYSSFFRGLSDWVGFKIEDISSRSLVMQVLPSSTGDSNYDSILAGMTPGDIKFADVLPFNTLFATSISTPSIGSYLDSYKRSLDTRGRLDRYRQANASLKDTLGITPEQMMIRLDVKEAVKATLRLESGPEGVLALRLGKQEASVLLRSTSMRQMREYKGEILPYLYKKFISTEFGELFSVEDESCFMVRGGWLFVGSRRVLSYISDTSLRSLQAYMQDGELGGRIPSKGLVALSYFSFTEYPPIIDAAFRPILSPVLRKTLDGITFSPMVLAVRGSDATFSVDRVTITRNTAPIVERDTVVVVPAGPYKAYNSANDKVYTLSQSANNTISLRDENNKGVWGIPFRNRITGYVQNIDYYSNGKVQWLFTAGSQMWLLDRAGRFVNGFPVELGKEVLLGPAVYDLNDSGDLRAMVLHTDNTVGFYDLKGNTMEGWKGIAAEETIKDLPEPIFVEGEVFWVVRTSIQTLFFPFEGGAPLAKGSKTPMVRPDTDVVVNGNGTVEVTCYDGKVRSIRLEPVVERGRNQKEKADRKKKVKEEPVEEETIEDPSSGQDVSDGDSAPEREKSRSERRKERKRAKETSEQSES